jgi:site-specific DNA-adenine methylase
MNYPDEHGDLCEICNVNKEARVFHVALSEHSEFANISKNENQIAKIKYRVRKARQENKRLSSLWIDIMVCKTCYENPQVKDLEYTELKP